MSVLTKNLLTGEHTASTLRSNWSAAGTALVIEALRRGDDGLHRPVRLQVRGESMLPALWPGDVVEIASCSIEDLRPGEIVLAMREGRLFLHRLVAPCTAGGFRLRGDSMPGSDPLYPPEALLGRLGRGTDQPRSSSSVTLSSATLSRALGSLLCHCSLARRLALRLHGWRKTSAATYRNLESI